jgi:Tfp pilus assembly protein PilO
VELTTFYKDVLPGDVAGARRLTYLRLNQLAREAGITLRDLQTNLRPQRDSTLDRFEITIALEGSYDNLRAFIYQLDTAPEFVVIDDVSLSDREGERGAVELSMRLSTYFSKAPRP